MAKFSPFKFLQEVRVEADKVTWPTRRETLITTLMVFVMVAVSSVLFLVADERKGRGVVEFGAFARALCERFGALQAHGNPGWRDIGFPLPELPRPWRYFAPTSNILDACEVPSGAPAAARPGARPSSHSR